MSIYVIFGLLIVSAINLTEANVKLIPLNKFPHQITKNFEFKIENKEPDSIFLIIIRRGRQVFEKIELTVTSDMHDNTEYFQIIELKSNMLIIKFKQNANEMALMILHKNIRSPSNKLYRALINLIIPPKLEIIQSGYIVDKKQYVNITCTAKNGIPVSFSEIEGFEGMTDVYIRMEEELFVFTQVFVRAEVKESDDGKIIKCKNNGAQITATLIYYKHPTSISITPPVNYTLAPKSKLECIPNYHNTNAEIYWDVVVPLEALNRYNSSIFNTTDLEYHNDKLTLWYIICTVNSTFYNSTKLLRKHAEFMLQDHPLEGEMEKKLFKVQSKLGGVQWSNIVLTNELKERRKFIFIIHSILHDYATRMFFELLQASIP